MEVVYIQRKERPVEIQAFLFRSFYISYNEKYRWRDNASIWEHIPTQVEKRRNPK